MAMRRRCWSRRAGRYVVCTRRPCPQDHGRCWSLNLERFVSCTPTHPGEDFHSSDHLHLQERPPDAILQRIRRARAESPVTWQTSARRWLSTTLIHSAVAR